jgi:hypothetical protein
MADSCRLGAPNKKSFLRPGVATPGPLSDLQSSMYSLRLGVFRQLRPALHYLLHPCSRVRGRFYSLVSVNSVAIIV